MVFNSNQKGMSMLRKLALGTIAVTGLVFVVASASPVEAHYTKNRLHEHIPHMGCKVLKYEDRDKPKVIALRASLKAQGYRLYFEGHCWLRPGHKYRANPCV